MSQGPSPDLLGHGPQPRSCLSVPPRQRVLDPCSYLCSSGDWLGDAHLNPAPCGRGRAVSGGHRPGVRPLATPSRDSRNRVSHQDNTEPPGSTVPSRHRTSTRVHPPPRSPPQPAGHNEAFIGAQSHPHICSALAPRFDVSPRRTPPHPTLRGGPGHRGALLWSQSRVFSCKISPPAQTMSLLWRARRRGRAEGPAGHCRTLAAGQEVTGLSSNAPLRLLGSGSPGTVWPASP